MKEIAKTSIEAVWDRMDPKRVSNTFELFGYDFMITNNLDILLIEINNNPDL